MKQQTPSAPIYPNLVAAEESSSSAPRLPEAQQFRSQKIGELQKRLMKKLKIKTEMLRRNGPVIKPCKSVLMREESL